MVRPFAELVAEAIDLVRIGEFTCDVFRLYLSPPGGENFHAKSQEFRGPGGFQRGGTVREQIAASGRQKYPGHDHTFGYRCTVPFLVAALLKMSLQPRR